MKQLILLLALLNACLSYAQTIRLTGTGKPELDGEYRVAGTRSGRNQYVKAVGAITYSIYCHCDEKASVWLIEDTNQNTYFGANADTAQPPSQGWDVGRAGKGLNAGFSLAVEPPAVAAPARRPQTRTVRLENNRNSTGRIIVRIVSAGRETLRARTYQPFEIYDYQTLDGDQIYLLTEQEGELLMSTKGVNVPGRFLLTVSEADADKVRSVYTN